MTIVEKVKNIINAQASLKEAFKAAFISLRHSLCAGGHGQAERCLPWLEGPA